MVIRERSFDDSATPAANGVAIANLVRLAPAAEDLSYRDRAEQALGLLVKLCTNCPKPVLASLLPSTGCVTLPSFALPGIKLPGTCNELRAKAQADLAEFRD